MPVLSLACHLPHNTPNIPSRYNNEQTTKQTKAINNSYIYIYIYISCKCDTNRAGHFTLDAYASRPVACIYMGFDAIWAACITIFSEILSEIHAFSLKGMYLKMSGKWRPFCFGLNVLTIVCIKFDDANMCSEALQWRHNGRDGVSNHQPHHRLLNRIFRRRSKKTSKLRVAGLCAGNSPVTGEFPAQMASNAENVSIWWRHHVVINHKQQRRHNTMTPQSKRIIACLMGYKAGYHGNMVPWYGIFQNIFSTRIL